MARLAHVLIVDDERLIRLNLRAFVEDLGYSVCEAANGREALTVFGQESPDVVLTDLRMPEMDGLALIAALREKAPETPLVVVSGTGTIKDAIAAVRLGAWDYLTKPVADQDEFEIVIKRVLERGRLLSENRHYQAHLEDMVQERTLKLHDEIAARQQAQEALAEEQRQLQLLNDTLEQRVREEVEKNRAKDQVMFQQARFAAMGEMLSNIAHQWRQPLNHIGLWLQNLQYDFAAHALDEASINNYVQSSMDTLQYMSQTISDFQHYFKPNRERQSFNVGKTVKTAVRLIEPALKSLGISIRVTKLGPECASGFPNEFTQVIVNLIHNAKDALTERRVHDPLIEIASSREGDLVVVSVRDNAGGIAGEVMEKIFDPYFTTKAKTQGTGLGLYMSKMIIEKSMGGRLTARNTAEGAEFVVAVAVTAPSPGGEASVS